MSDILTILACLATVGFGLFGFLAPAYTARVLDLAPDGSSMGYSEIRASVGGLFVVTAAAALILWQPLAFAMLGFAYAGAALGRALSLILDNPPRTKVAVWGGIEAVLAAWLLWVGFS